MSSIRLSKYLLTLVWIALISLAGCSSRGMAARTMSWQEEVLLHDGRIAIAERHYDLGGIRRWTVHSVRSSMKRQALLDPALSNASPGTLISGIPFPNRIA